MTHNPVDHPSADTGPRNYLNEISTRWSLVNDPVQFVMRYAPAIRHALATMIASPHDVDELAQDFLVRMLEQSFAHVKPDHGKFRFYLLQAVRNSVRAFYRRGRALPRESVDLDELADTDSPELAEEQWIAQWRACLLDRTWSALEAHQHRSPGNLFYTALRLLTASPADDSVALAARCSEAVGRPLSSAAFRQQVSRARRQFARLLVKEVGETLERPTRERIEEELIELRLLEYVRDFLPAENDADA